MSALLPFGPQRLGEQAGNGQNREIVGTPNADAMCMGPVLAEIR